MMRKFWEFKKLHLPNAVFIDIKSITSIDELPGNEHSIVRTADGHFYQVEGKALTHKINIEEAF